MGKRVGFTGKTSRHKGGRYINIPKNTARSLDLKDKDKVKVEIRNMDGRAELIDLQVSETSGYYKLYIGAEVVETLELGHKELVDIFMEKR